VADPLAQFRRKIENPPAPSHVAAVAAGRQAYEAFNAVDRERKRLHIRPAVQPWVWASNSYLQYIAEDSGRGTRFSLVFGFLVVVITGRNLGKMIAAINSENCEFIEEFDPSRHAKPEPDEPVIESIAYYMDKEKRAEILDDVQGVESKRRLEKT
jgi:hypothetical protein